MAKETTPVEINVTVRRIDAPGPIREYVHKKLARMLRGLPNLRSVEVEVTLEHTRPADQRYVVQVTLRADGTLLRAEDRGPDVRAAVDAVHDRLDRRIRDWKGRVYFTKRRERAAYKRAQAAEGQAPEPQEGAASTDGIVRMKSFEIKPMFPEDAVEQMELLGHDFFFFLNAETGQYNVVYRRKAGGYGLIEPAFAEGGPSE